MIQKFKTFWHSFINSASSPRYYNDVLSAKPRFSWQYLVVLVLLAGLVGIGEFLATTLPWVNDFDASQAIHTVAAMYPDDLEFSVVDGSVVINQELPYSVELPGFLEGEDGFSDTVDSLVLFTTDDIIYDAVRDSSALFIVGQTIVYVPDEIASEGRVYYRAYSVPDDQQVEVISKAEVSSYESEIIALPFIANRWYVFAFVLAVVVIGLFIVFPFMLVGKILFAFVLATVGWTMTLVLSKKLTFSQVLHLTFHALTPLLIIESLVDLMGQFSFNLLWALGCYVVWMYIVFNAITPIERKEI